MKNTQEIVLNDQPIRVHIEPMDPTPKLPILPDELVTRIPSIRDLPRWEDG